MFSSVVFSGQITDGQKSYGPGPRDAKLMPRSPGNQILGLGRGWESRSLDAFRGEA
jgi:hypothetical protein